MDAMAKRGVRLITRFDPDFPILLRQMAIPPVAIYVAGELMASDELAVGVVGPRAPTNYGREICTANSGKPRSSGYHHCQRFRYGRGC